MIFTSDQLAACAHRELGWRRKVYANRVATHRMTQSKADAEIAMMQAIFEHFQAMAETDQVQERLL